MPDPAVLFVHGLGSTHQQNWVDSGWVDILEAEGFRAIGAELPGHGGTAPDTASIDAVLGAVDGLGPVRAVGFSAGAAELLAAAVREPGRFDRIALLGIGDGILDGPDPQVGALVGALRDDNEPEDVRTRLFWRLAESAGNDRARVADFLEHGRTSIDVDDLARVTCPVLIVLGDRDEAAPADRLIDALPDARGVRLRGVDHFATTSDIGAIDAVVRFLGD